MRARSRPGGESSAAYVSIYEVVRGIPPGRVATYGQIAELAGFPGQARMVGYALHALGEDHTVPWQRVINARGEISRRGDREWERFQRTLLEEEAVSFNTSGRVDLQKYRWRPGGDPESRSSGGLHGRIRIGPARPPGAVNIQLRLPVPSPVERPAEYGGHGFPHIGYSVFSADLVIHQDGDTLPPLST